MFRSLFDLPSHIFLVHAPIVLIPLVGAAAAVYAWWEPRTRWFGGALTAAAFGVTVATWAAVQSGEEFKKLIEGSGIPIEKHESLAKTTMLLVFGMALSILVLYAFRSVHIRRGTRLSSTLAGSLGLLTVALAVLSVVWVVRTGHEGARLVWTGVVPEASP